MGCHWSQGLKSSEPGVGELVGALTTEDLRVDLFLSALDVIGQTLWAKVHTAQTTLND